MPILVRVQRNRENYIYKIDLYLELAHTIIEVEKSHIHLFTSWRPRKAGAVIQSEFEGLGIRSTCAQRQQNMDVPAQAKRTNLPFLCFIYFFNSVQGPHRLHDAQQSQGKLLYSVHQFRCYSLLKTPSQIIFHQLPDIP